MAERQFVKLLDVSSNLTSDSKSCVLEAVMFKIGDIVKFHHGCAEIIEIQEQNKCVICGKHLRKFRFYSFSQRFKNYIIYGKPIIKFASFLTHKPYTRGMRVGIKIKKDIDISKDTSIGIYCSNCGQIYSDNKFNFRELPLRKRV